jgi:hypothetical protein
MFLMVSISACKKNDSKPKPELFDSNNRNFQLNSGFKNRDLSIKAGEWSVEYVKDAVSGKMLLDQTGKPMALKALGTVELQDGWLLLERKQANKLLTLSLKENFSNNPRKFLIGILANGISDELSFTQLRGEAYEIVEKEITEVPGSRKEYTNSDGLHAITVTNNDFIAKYMDITDIYIDAKIISEFDSKDDDAFGWVHPDGTTIFMNELVREGVTYWSSPVTYKKGKSIEPYATKGFNKMELLVKANTTIKVRGEIHYVSRECLYTFTVKNVSSGNTFETSGTWKQTAPISTNSIIYE